MSDEDELSEAYSDLAIAMGAYHWACVECDKLRGEVAELKEQVKFMTDVRAGDAEIVRLMKAQVAELRKREVWAEQVMRNYDCYDEFCDGLSALLEGAK